MNMFSVGQCNYIQVKHMAVEVLFVQVDQQRMVAHLSGFRVLFENGVGMPPSHILQEVRLDVPLSKSDLYILQNHLPNNHLEVS